MLPIAKVFRNGASQAVRLPKECRFKADEVCAKRIGSAVLLFPRKSAWRMMAQAIGQADDDFLADRRLPTKADKRKSL